MIIERFEDIVSWQKARLLTKEVYNCSKMGAFAKDFDLRKQIQSASVSIMSNIAEGFEPGGDKEFTQFLAAANGSCGEVRSQLYVALDQGYLLAPKFEELYGMSTETSRVISGLMNYLTRSELRGSKFK